MSTLSIEEKVKHFVDHLNFSDEEIKSYAKEFNIPEETMKNMAVRITRELKHDLEEALS